MTGRPIRIAILALGGQGGGVLSRWIINLAESQGWIAQATSVPGVAQRTGTTVYYLEIAAAGDRRPVMALMPASGDVDIVIAAEFMEAGRAIARGFVHPDRTTLIASSHRIFSIGEKSAMSDGRIAPSAVLESARNSSRRLVLADFAQVAVGANAPISAALFGALAGCGALPFSEAAFLMAIDQSDKFAAENRAAFAAGRRAAEEDAGDFELDHHSVHRDGDGSTGGFFADLPEPARPVARLAADRLRDYQDERLVRLYLDRLRAFADADRELGGGECGFLMTVTAARHLALWMTYEDVFRVADLKTRAERMARIEAGAGAAKGEVVHVTDFLHPRFEEICDSLPRRIGAWLRDSMGARRLFDRAFARGRFVRTSGPFGFLQLWALARAARWRRATLRWHEEQHRIEAWLDSALNAARSDYRLGVEILRLQQLVKGYGDTHRRGLTSFRTIMGAIRSQGSNGDLAPLTEQLRQAALADDEGMKLRQALSALPGGPTQPSAWNEGEVPVPAPQVARSGE